MPGGFNRKNFREDKMKINIIRFLNKSAILIFFCMNLQAFEWLTDFKKAAADAKLSNKFILLDFTGSDWCGWCKKLDKEVLSTDEFKKYVDKNLICVSLDFPRNISQSVELKAQNNDLANKYKIEGYPTVIILSPLGELVAKTGYQEGGATKYIKNIEDMINAFNRKHGK